MDPMFGLSAQLLSPASVGSPLELLLLHFAHNVPYLASALSVLGGKTLAVELAKAVGP